HRAHVRLHARAPRLVAAALPLGGPVDRISHPVDAEALLRLPVRRGWVGPELLRARRRPACTRSQGVSTIWRRMVMRAVELHEICVREVGVDLLAHQVAEAFIA